MNTWEIPVIKSTPKFIAVVAKHLPSVRILSFEVQKANADALAVYAKHRSSIKLRPFRDTISPKTELHYCDISQTLSDDLKRLLKDHEYLSVLWHVKGFSQDKQMIFALHDADSFGCACFSPNIDAKQIKAIAATMGETATEIDTFYNWNKYY